MSTPQKLRGGKESELTRLKKLWRDSLAESARDFWRALFISETKQSEIRSQIATKLKVNLTYDKQLNQLRKWIAEQDARDEEAARMLDDERRLTEQFGDTLTKDQIRDKVLRASYARSLAIGDHKLGLATVKQDVNVQKAQLIPAQIAEVLTKLDDFLASVLKRAEELNQTSMSQADKIATMRREYFKDVEALKQSGKLNIPQS